MVAQSILGPARWLSIMTLLGTLGACGGGGGGQMPLQPNPQNPGGPTPTDVTISGKITFDRIPFKTTRNTGLNPQAPVESPARGIVVEAMSGNAAIASTVTDSSGNYSLTVPSNTTVSIRAKAQMLKAGTAPTWNFRVLDNTFGDALYALDGAATSSGTTNSTRNLKAPTGWGTSSYTSTRAAAPFAILDSVFGAVTLVTSARSNAAFDALDFYWASTNRSGTVNQNGEPIYCLDNGDVQTTFYTAGTSADDCGGTFPAGIYVLGAFPGDTDEFDQHVIAHEFGHYIEDKFSRSDSIGGSHSGGDPLDLRVAFGEGWGNAFGAMALNDPVYRDSFSGVNSDFGFDLETDLSDQGWSSESSVGEILWDLFDGTNDDPAAVGFTSIFAAMTGAQRTTNALTSIFSFAEALRSVAPSEASNINTLLQGENISGSDAFALGETNDAGLSSLGVLPIYRPLQSGAPEQVCVRGVNADSFNRVGFYKFYRFSLANAGTVSITLFGQALPPAVAAVDPDIEIFRNGASVFQSQATGSSETDNVQLNAGTYVLQLFDFDLIEHPANSTRCITISANGI